MKFIIAFTLTLFSLGAFAQEDLATMKEQANAHIDSKMTSLQSAKGCINNATTMDKYKACKYDMKKEMKMHKMEAEKEMSKDKQKSED